MQFSTHKMMLISDQMPLYILHSTVYTWITYALLQFSSLFFLTISNNMSIFIEFDTVPISSLEKVHKLWMFPPQGVSLVISCCYSMVVFPVRRTPMWDWDTAAPLSYSVLSWDSHIHKTVSSFCLHFYWRKRHMGSFAGTTYNHLQCCLYILFSFFLLKCTFISFCYFKTMLLE